MNAILSESDIIHGVTRDGYAIVRGIVDDSTIRSLIDAVTTTGDGPALRQRGSRMYAMRDLLRISSALRDVAHSRPVGRIVETILGQSGIPVRGILFDKVPGANWKVAWHQDLSIAVREQRDVNGFGPWSLKAGIPHVQPPVEILQQMITMRLNLDDCDEDNGPLRVLPGSHAHGVLSDDQIAEWRTSHQPISCTGAAGDALFMRPLLLHASSSATSPAHRRVIHIEFASGSLPGGLRWHEEREE